MTTALSLLKPIASPAQLLSYHDDVAKIVQNALTPDVDFGLIPGTGDKPSLLKPGAEKLCLAFGAHPEYELIEYEGAHDAEIVWVKRKKIWRKGERGFDWGEETGNALGLYRYRYRCKIVLADGRIIAMAEGVCSTLESKYVDRPRDSENTVCKMAQKRAFVAAVLHAFALSNRFTQDIEDMRHDPDVQVEARRAGNGRQQHADQRRPPVQHVDDAPPSVEPPQEAKPAAGRVAGRGSIYTGTREQQQLVEDILRKKNVSDSLWATIDDKLMNRPSGDLMQIIREVTAAAQPTIDAEAVPLQ